MLNQLAIVAFYSCFEEQKGQFRILVPVGRQGLKFPECWLIKLRAGYCRHAPTSIVTTLVAGAMLLVPCNHCLWWTMGMH